MAFKELATFKICVVISISVCALSSLKCVSGQSCPAPNQEAINLMKLVKLVTHDLGTCDAVDDIMPRLTSYLETCAFVTQADAVSYVQCSGICKSVNNCSAFFMSRTGGCEVCLTTTSGTGGNGNDYDVNKLMIRAEYLRDFINCESLLKVTHHQTGQVTSLIFLGI